MACPEFQTRLNSLLSGELRGEEARQVRSHLAQCSRCLSSLSSDDLTELMPLIDEDIEPAQDMNRRFRARLAAHREQASATGRYSFARLMLERFSVAPAQLAALGTLAAFLLLGTYLGMYHVPAPGPMPGSGELPIAENLPLLQNLGVIRNLDLLEDFDAIEDTSPDEPEPAPDK